MNKIICNKCKKEMKFLGNISGIIYTSYPEQWDDVYICEKCKVKKTIREHGTLPPDYSFVKDYPEQRSVSEVVKNLMKKAHKGNQIGFATGWAHWILRKGKFSK